MGEELSAILTGVLIGLILVIIMGIIGAIFKGKKNKLIRNSTRI